MFKEEMRTWVGEGQGLHQSSVLHGVYSDDLNHSLPLSWFC